MFFSTDPKTIDDLNMICASESAKGNHVKVANVAYSFRNSSAKSLNYSDEEKIIRIANAYYWMCKSTKNQLAQNKDKQLYDLLVSFFALHKLGYRAFQQFLMKDFIWNENHPMYSKYEEINNMYDDVYKSFDAEIIQKADSSANTQLDLA